MINSDLMLKLFAILRKLEEKSMEGELKHRVFGCRNHTQNVIYEISGFC